jgi:hypothetical protein
MKTAWTAHLDNEEQKELFRNRVHSSKDVLERQTEILDERLKAIDKIQTGVEIYKQPGWDALQAYYNGCKATLKLIKQLNDLDQKDYNDPRDSTGQQ